MGISPMAVISRVDVQLKPACWICSWAWRENCSDLRTALNPVGLSGSISFSRLVMVTTWSPEAVCSMSATCFLRRASKNFSPTLTAIRISAKTTTKATMTPTGIS